MDIKVEDSALNHFKNSLAERGRGIGIRIGVKTTGCSGLAYVLEYVDKENLDDLSIVIDDFRIFVDIKSSVYLDGMLIKHEKNIFHEGISFVNPNERSRCGCGESFQV